MRNPDRDAQIAHNLAVWFGRAARDLPWRRTRDPYRIWLSEVMLQQTRVDTVIPYYERFLERFPTVRALAEANLDDVLALWAGLGYYSRARSLQRAAQQMVERHNAEVPRDPAALRDLAGIGPYTAGAVSSIAFNLPEPLVDGNVARVLARVHKVESDIKSPEAQEIFWQSAARLVRADPAVPPSVLNQALMELGALLCTPTRPACGMCPLEKLCKARIENITETLPITAPRAKPKPANIVSAVVWHAGKVLLARRKAQGLFGGMWEPPLFEAASLENARPFFEPFLFPVTELRIVTRKPLRHVLSHRSLAVHVAAAALSTPPPETTFTQLPDPYDRSEWAAPATLAGGLSALAIKILGAAPDPGAPLVLSPSAAKPARASHRKT
ncbi:MAG: A/G-specific adenine glycosylase [Polyangiaceae bacterium]|nr:A/G-specific adenine glycosylase [Polyangiaceae bacterium]